MMAMSWPPQLEFITRLKNNEQKEFSMSKTPSVKTDSGYLTRKQIAHVLNVPHRTVDQWIATGQITPIRVSTGIGRGGQRVYYSAADVAKLKSTRKSGKPRARNAHPQ
jgi:excisionase family DNA binding protein